MREPTTKQTRQPRNGPPAPPICPYSRQNKVQIDWADLPDAEEAEVLKSLTLMEKRIICCTQCFIHTYYCDNRGGKKGQHGGGMKVVFAPTNVEDVCWYGLNPLPEPVKKLFCNIEKPRGGATQFYIVRPHVVYLALRWLCKYNIWYNGTRLTVYSLPGETPEEIKAYVRDWCNHDQHGGLYCAPGDEGADPADFQRLVEAIEREEHEREECEQQERERFKADATNSPPVPMPTPPDVECDGRPAPAAMSSSRNGTAAPPPHDEGDKPAPDCTCVEEDAEALEGWPMEPDQVRRVLSAVIGAPVPAAPVSHSALLKMANEEARTIPSTNTKLLKDEEEQGEPCGFVWLHPLGDTAFFCPRPVRITIHEYCKYHMYANPLRAKPLRAKPLPNVNESQPPQ
eukprot:tig00020561_g11102.t1